MDLRRWSLWISPCCQVNACSSSLLGLAFLDTPNLTRVMIHNAESTLILDHGTHIFVWESGTYDDHGAKVHQSCQELVSGLAAGRFPVPEVRTAKEVQCGGCADVDWVILLQLSLTDEWPTLIQGSGDSRYVVSRLVPVHRDSPQHQAVQFPAAASWSTDERKRLFAKLAPTDTPSLFEWARQYRVDVTQSATDVLAARVGSVSL